MTLALLSGCGTVAGRHQHLSIDSSPRGVAVVDDEGKPIGRTPVFHRIVRDDHIEIGVPNSNGVNHPVVSSCGYRWAISPLENLPLIVLSPSPWLWPLGLSIDWLSGAAYACPDRLVLPKGVVQVAEVKPMCPRYLVLGPRTLGTNAYTTVVDRWFAAQKARTPCAEVVDAGPRRWRLVRTRLDDTDAEQRQRLYRLGYESRATHLARLAYTWREETVTVDAHVIDLHRQSAVEVAPVVFRPASDVVDALRPGLLERHLRGNLSLIPDALGVGIGARRGKVKARSGSVLESRDLGSFILRLGTASHPDAYRPWDFDLNFGSAFAFEFFKKFLPKSTAASADLALNFNRAAIYGNASGTLHTPLGSLRLAIGYGGAYYGVSEPESLEGHHFLTELNVKLGYTAFFTERLYGQLYFEAVIPRMKASKFDTQIKQLLDGGIVIGYHFPELGDLARSWF